MALESLIILVLGKRKSDALEQAQDTLRIATSVAEDIEKATTKCNSIKEIDGRSAVVVGLKMTGQTAVENIRVAYVSDGQTQYITYSKQEFYDL